MAKETNQLKFGDFQVIVIMVAYSQKVLYLGYVLKKVPNHYPEFFHFTCFTLKSWGLAILLEMIKLKNFLSTYTNKKSHFGICIRGHSTTTWTQFCCFLTPPGPPRGQFLYPEHGQKQTFFDPPPNPRSYWMTPIHYEINFLPYIMCSFFFSSLCQASIS